MRPRAVNADTARLFLGLELNDEARCTLDGVRRALQESGVVGKFHAPSLYHLTLCFLGNTPVHSIPMLKQLMDGIPASPFSLTLSALGTFKGGTILWAGVKESPALMEYQARLASSLRQAGFPLEEGEYRPHITLGRQVKTAPAELAVPDVSFRVKCATLFESTRVDGSLAYIPLYRSVFH